MPAWANAFIPRTSIGDSFKVSDINKYWSDWLASTWAVHAEVFTIIAESEIGRIPAIIDFEYLKLIGYQDLEEVPHIGSYLGLNENLEQTLLLRDLVNLFKNKKLKKQIQPPKNCGPTINVYVGKKWQELPIFAFFTCIEFLNTLTKFVERPWVAMKQSGPDEIEYWTNDPDLDPKDIQQLARIKFEEPALETSTSEVPSQVTPGVISAAAL